MIGNISYSTCLESLLNHPWTPEASLRIDRWLAELPEPMPDSPLYVDGDFPRFKAMVRSVALMPEHMHSTLLSAIAQHNGQKLELVQAVFEEVAS